MDIGLPQKTITITPLKEPIPEREPAREPFIAPEEPVLEPAKVGE